MEYGIDGDGLFFKYQKSINYNERIYCFCEIRQFFLSIFSKNIN